MSAHLVSSLFDEKRLHSPCYRLFFSILFSNSLSISSIEGNFVLKFSGIASVRRYSLIPIGLFMSLSAYSTSILSLLLHKRIPIDGLSFVFLSWLSIADK